MKASSADQLKLLDIAELDQTLLQLAHKANSLPEHDAIKKNQIQRSEVETLLIAITTEQTDIRKELNRADTDVEQVRSRQERDTARLNSGQGSAKDLEALQHELATLARRQSELEDIELEIMERMESAQHRESELRAQAESLDTALAELTTARDKQLAEIEGQQKTTNEMRSILVSQIDAALLAQYQKISESISAPGAAAVRQKKCQGCRLELNATEIEKFRATADDEVLRCEECRRILVRVSDSGL